MNIIGIGIDILNIKRINNMNNKKINKFAKKILTKNEYKKYKNLKNKKEYFLAKKFTAKEAISKALGIGIKNGTLLKNFEIYNNKKGKPKIKILNKIFKIFKIKKNNKIHISITDEKKYAQSIVIIEN